MDRKLKNKLIAAARRMSMAWKPRNVVKARCKRDKATYECQKCGTYVYEGKSESSYLELKEKYPNKELRMEAFHIDHISPVVDIDGWTTWEDFYNSLFCGEDNLRGLCSTKCHASKSKKEQEIRRLKKQQRNKGNE